MAHRNYKFDEHQKNSAFVVMNLTSMASISLTLSINLSLHFTGYGNSPVDAYITHLVNTVSPYTYTFGFTLLGISIVSKFVYAKLRNKFPVLLLVNKNLDELFYNLNIYLPAYDSKGKVIYPDVKPDRDGFKIEAITGKIDDILDAKK